MIHIYTIILSSGRKVLVNAGSAAAAIEHARWLWRGLTVTGCYSGVKQDDLEQIRRMVADSKPIVGWIDHEVPPHDPIPFDAVKPKSRWTNDDSLPMFDDKAIEAESQKAKDKFNGT
jgi:hypothetical protein